MTAEHQRRICVTPHKTAWTAIVTSIVLHSVGFAALASWTASSKTSLVRFAGREQAFELTLSFAQPQWNIDPMTLDDFATDLPVVIEPDKARIGKHTYVHTPTVEVSADDLLLDSAIDSIEQPSELATVGDVHDDELHDHDDELHDIVKQSTPRTPTIEHRQANPKTSNLAIAVPPSNLASNLASNLGNTEDIPPDLSQNAPPTYPAHAIQSGWEGTVLLRVWIDETGHITKVKVARTSGYRILDGAAAAAVRQWNAIPANRGAKPVSTVELLPVRFKL